MQSLSTQSFLIPVLLLVLSTPTSTNPLPYAAPAPVAAPFPQTSNGLGGYGPSGIDVSGGAGGSSGAFHLGTGGIVAIAVVVSVVVVLGIASTILFYLAKKRQWEVRKSLRRASRRVTGKLTGRRVLTREEEERRERRHGAVRLAEGKSRAARDMEKARRQARATEAKRAEAGVRGVEMKDILASTKSEKKVGVVMPPT